MVSFILFIIIGVIFIALGFTFIILAGYELYPFLFGMFILVVGLFSLNYGIDGVKKEGQTIKPIEYKQVITTKPTLGKTKSNKDTIIYITDTTYLQK